MAKIGVPSNEKIFKAVQELLGEEIFLPKGVFFIPFRGHELVVARVEEIVSLTSKGHLDLSFATSDHFDEAGGEVSSILSTFSEHCKCEMSLVTADCDFWNMNAKKAIIEFNRKLESAKKNFRKAIIATRFPKTTENFLRPKEWNLWEEKFFPEIRKVYGTEELSILLGVADFAVVRIESGRTLKLNNLLVVDKLAGSRLIMVRHENFSKSKAWEVYGVLIRPKPLPSRGYISLNYETPNFP